MSPAPKVSVFSDALDSRARPHAEPGRTLDSDQGRNPYPSYIGISTSWKYHSPLVER
jgi:hypothetical protein